MRFLRGRQGNWLSRVGRRGRLEAKTYSMCEYVVEGYLFLDLRGGYQIV